MSGGWGGTLGGGGGKTAAGSGGWLGSLGGSSSPHHTNPVSGFLGHLAGDVRDAVVGLPMGVVGLVHHPVGSLEAIGKATWHDWSPLFHGNVGKFGHQVYDHPLAPLLDVATVFSGGASLAGKVGVKLSEAGVDNAFVNAIKEGARPIPYEDRAVPKEGEAPRMTQYRETSKNPLKRAVQLKAHSLSEAWQNHLPQWFTPQGTFERLHFHAAMGRHAGMVRANMDAIAAEKSLREIHAANSSQLAALSWAGKSVTENADLITPIILNRLFEGVTELAPHYEDRIVTSSGSYLKRAIKQKITMTDRAAMQESARLKGVAARGLSNLGVMIRPEDAQGLLDQAVKDEAKYRPEAHLYRAQHNLALAKITHLTDYIKHDKLLSNEKNFQKVVDTTGHEYARRALPKGWVYVRADSAELRKTFEHNPKSTLEQRLLGQGSVMTTTSAKAAARDASGKALIAQSRTLRDLGIEGAKSVKFLKWWYKYPTQVWKMALVGLSPKMVVDNAVGNWTMYAMRQSGHHAIRGIYDAMRQTRGLKTADASLGSAAAKFLNPHWMERYFKNELGQSFFGSTLGDAMADPTSPQWLPDVFNEPHGKIKGGLYPLVHKIADQPVRRASISAFMHGAPEVKALLREKGMKFDQAVSHALANDKTHLHYRATEHAKNIAGDYHTISDMGRTVRDFVPFYLWDRHILRHFRNLSTEAPARVAMLQALSHQGVAATTAALGGNVPEFLLGSVPMGGSKGGRQNILDPRGLNPYSSIGDLADVFSAATGGGQRATAGEAIGGELNPVLTGAFEAMSGHRLGTDAKVPQHGGVIPTTLVNMAEGLPQERLIAALAGNAGNPKNPKNPPLYHYTIKSILTNMFGFPEKSISSSRVSELADTEQHKKKGKKAAWAL